jgi:hypothetical protein
MFHEFATGTKQTRQAGFDRPFLSGAGPSPWPMGLVQNTPPGTCSRSVRRVSISPAGRLSKTPRNRWGRYGSLLREPAALTEQCGPTSPWPGEYITSCWYIRQAPVWGRKAFFCRSSPPCRGRPWVASGVRAKKQGPARSWGRPRKDSHQSLSVLLLTCASADKPDRPEPAASSLPAQE